jgi:hypothetical protein
VGAGVLVSFASLSVEPALVVLISVAPVSFGLASAAGLPARQAANETIVVTKETRNERLDIFLFTAFSATIVRLDASFQNVSVSVADS